MQTFALNLASLAMKLFLQDMQNLARILQEKFARSFSCKILTKYCKKIILQFFLARKASLLVQDWQVLVQDLQDLVQELASHARKILARFGYFLQDGFYWEIW